MLCKRNISGKIGENEIGMGKLFDGLYFTLTAIYFQSPLFFTYPWLSQKRGGNKFEDKTSGRKIH